MIAAGPVRVAFAGDAARFAAWVPGGVAAAVGAPGADPAPSRTIAAGSGGATPPRTSVAEGAGASGSPAAARTAGDPGAVWWAATPRLHVTLVDTRGPEPAAVASALRAARPDLVVALGVAGHDAATLRAVGVPVLGVVDAAEDVAERARLWRPGSPGAACDRLVALDPLAAAGGRLWRLIAPPVDDALFGSPTRARRPPSVVFAGPSTEHRERWLAEAKHLHDVRHVAHGVTPDRLPKLLDQVDVALNAHPTPRRTFEHRVAVHLAAGHLVLTEPLSPRHGLEPGIDHLEAADPDAVARAVGAIRAAPDLFRRTRVRGRLKAERFRASHVWERVAADLLRDLG